MLYIPWRDEDKDVLSQDLEKLYQQNKEQIKSGRQKHTAFDEKPLLTALEDILERNDSEDEEEFNDDSRPTFD